MHEGATFWGEDIFNFLFECNCDNDVCDRKQVDFDDDRDGFTRIQDNDCQDNPEADPSGVECPTIDEEDYVGLTREEIREQIKGLCNYPAFSLCSICINPAAPEICGDGGYCCGYDDPNSNDDDGGINGLGNVVNLPGVERVFVSGNRWSWTE